MSDNKPTETNDWREFRDRVDADADAANCGILVHLHSWGAASEPSPYIPHGQVRHINHTEVADAR